MLSTCDTWLYSVRVIERIITVSYEYTTNPTTIVGTDTSFVGTLTCPFLV